MKRYTLFFIFAHSAVFAINLTETLNLAKEHDPGYRSQVLDLKATLFNDKIAAGKLAPSIDIAFYGSNTTVDTTATDSSGNLKLTINADIYNANTISNYKKGKIETQEALLKLNELDLEHTIKTSNQYFDTLKALSNVKVKRFALEQYEKSYQEAIEKENAGLISNVEVLSYLASLDLAKLALTSSVNNLDHKLKTLEGHINTPINKLHTYEGTAIPDLSLPPINELLDYALSSGYRIKLANTSVKKARNAVNNAENNFVPKATVSFERAQPIHTLKDHFFESSYSTQKLYLTLSLNAFSGFTDYNNYKKQKTKYLASESFLDEELYSVKLAIEKAYKDHENNTLEAKASLSAMQSANAYLDAISERHLLGKISEIEYKAAITEASKTQESFYTSIYNLMAGYLYLKSITSTLDSTDIERINQYLKTEISVSQSANPS